MKISDFEKTERSIYVVGSGRFVDGNRHIDIMHIHSYDHSGCGQYGQTDRSNVDE